jgi:hypothetical protein
MQLERMKDRWTRAGQPRTLSSVPDLVPHEQVKREFEPSQPRININTISGIKTTSPANSMLVLQRHPGPKDLPLFRNL